jgi:hypothetical protein
MQLVKPSGQKLRELTDELLEFVVGGAGDLPPAVLEWLLHNDAIRPMKSSLSTT